MIYEINLEKVLFLDIETVPQEWGYANLDENTQTLWESKTAYLQKDGTSPEEVYKKAGIYAELAGSALQETAEVRGDGKGRHTTTHRHLLRLPSGGLIIDTPGMRELQLWESQTGLADTFADIDQLAIDCRFSDCQHASEPGCAVVDALTRGQLAEDRLESYQKLQRELAYLERKQDARAQSEEKRRIKSMMKSLRDHPKYNR